MNRPAPLLPDPSPSTAELTGGLSRLRQAIAQAADLGLQLERGQAQTPLHEHFLSLGKAVDAGALSVILVALDAHSRAAALRWCLGPANGSPSGAAELPRAQNAQDPERKDLAVFSDMHGMQVLVPTSPALLVGNPGLVSQLLAQSNILIVAGPAGAPIDNAVRQAVQELAAGVRMTWGVVCGSQSAPTPGSWPAMLQACCPVLTYLDPSQTLPPSPFALAETSRALRSCLSGLQLACRLDSSLPILEARLAQDIRQQDTRRKMLLRRSAGLGEREKYRDPHQMSATARQTLEDGLGQIDARLAASLRERTLPASACANRINNLLEDLSKDDLVEEAASHSAYLGLSADFKKRALGLLHDIVREDVAATVRLLHDEVGALCSKVGATVSEMTEKPANLRPTLPEVETVWAALQRSLHLDFNYRAEMPRRGFFDLIMHGRRPVVMLTMALTLAGAAFGAGHNLTTKLAPLMLLLFAGAVGWGVHEFRQERHERLDKELDRLRQTLGPELKRLYEQVLRDWHGQLSRDLRDLQRDLLQQTGEPLLAHAAEVARGNAQDRGEIQERLKIIDNRLRELTGLRQHYQRLQQMTAEALQVLERVARNALDAHRAAMGKRDAPRN